MRFSVTVPSDQAEPLRSALFVRLCRHIIRVQVTPAIEPGSREPLLALQIDLEGDALHPALDLVMATATRAQVGAVQRSPT